MIVGCVHLNQTKFDWTELSELNIKPASHVEAKAAGLRWKKRMTRLCYMRCLALIPCASIPGTCIAFWDESSLSLWQTPWLNQHLQCEDPPRHHYLAEVHEQELHEDPFCQPKKQAVYSLQSMPELLAAGRKASRRTPSTRTCRSSSTSFARTDGSGWCMDAGSLAPKILLR